MQDLKTILSIRELKVETIIGFYPEERAKKQPVIINISYEVSEPESMQRDDVLYTVNYAEIAEEVYNKVKESQFNLLETLGKMILGLIMRRDKIKWAEVELIKPNAPLPNTKGSSVKMAARR